MRTLTFSVAALLVAGFGFAAADDLETTFQSLKEAEATKDAPHVKKLAVEAIARARQAAAAPAPDNAEEKEGWKQRVEYAHSIELHAEYSLYATAVQSPPATMIDLITTLEAQNPKSKYLDEAYGPYLVALTKTGASAKVPEVAEKALLSFPDNEDLLLVVAENARSRNPDRALTCSNRLVSVLSRHPKPEGVSAAEWERKRSASLGRGYWMAGVISGERNRYADADRNLRAALPLIGGNDAMMGPALFYLGFANYQLGKMTNSKAKVLEGAKFSEQAAAINWPGARDAYKNSLNMKTEVGKMR